MLDMMGKASGKDVQMTAAELAAAAKRFFTSVIASKDWDLQVWSRINQHDNATSIANCLLLAWDMCGMSYPTKHR